MKRRHLPAVALGVAALSLALAGLAGAARADVRTYVLAIGNNLPPGAADASAERLPVLRYADDDAAAFFTFARDLSEEATLLTVLDARSQERFPGLASVARAPSLVELRRVLARYKARFEADRSAGHEPVLLFFFSGHGTRPGDQPASLVMTDGPLTQRVLYDEVLAALPARYVHLIVDACYAEAVVVPRDGHAEQVVLSPADLQTIAQRGILSRFPNVGAVIATSTAARAYEWDAIERGVFTHELLSGLRGAADANADGRVEYDELYAFLASANRGVDDPRARLAVIAHAPPLDMHAPLVDLARLRGAASLAGAPAPLGRVYVEDALGNRLLDVNAEAAYRMNLRVPPGRLYIHTNVGEALVEAFAGKTLEFSGLTLTPSPLLARGAMEGSMERGLFAQAFGPTYYRAFVDGHGESDFGSPAAAPPASSAHGSKTAAWVTLGGAGALAAATAVFVGVALSAKSDYDGTSIEREATAARDRFGTFQALSIVGAGATLVAGGFGAWLALRRSAPDPNGVGASGARFYAAGRGAGVTW